MLEHRLPGAGLLPGRAASCGHRDSREALQRVEDLTDFMQHRLRSVILLLLIKGKEKPAEMNRQILIYTWMVIAE